MMQTPFHDSLHLPSSHQQQFHLLIATWRCHIHRMTTEFQGQFRVPPLNQGPGIGTSSTLQMAQLRMGQLMEGPVSPMGAQQQQHVPGRVLEVLDICIRRT